MGAPLPGGDGAGRDPRRPPVITTPLDTVSVFLDLYADRYVRAERLKSAASVMSRLGALKAHLGERPVRDLERVEVIEDFKVAFGKGRTIATVNRTLGVLRHAITGGGRNACDFRCSPSFRFGVKIKTKGETKRDRRCVRGGAQLLSAADKSIRRTRFAGARCEIEYRRARDRLPTGRDAEIQNRHVQWDTHQISFPAEHAKDGKPDEFRSANGAGEVLKRRRFLGPKHSCSASLVSSRHDPDSVGFARLVGCGTKPKRASGTHASIVTSSRKSTCIGTICATKRLRWLPAGLDLRRSNCCWATPISRRRNDT